MIIENTISSYAEEKKGSWLSPTSPELCTFEQEARTFDDFTRKVPPFIPIDHRRPFFVCSQLEEALTILNNLKRDEYESQMTLKVLQFLENLINQPKEWISGAKLKLSELKFPGQTSSPSRN